MDSVRKQEISAAHGNDSGDEYVSVPQAAKALGKAAATIRTLALKRELVGEIVAGRVVITRQSIDAYRTRHPDEVPSAVARES